jgi:hypothetical protein
MSRPWIGLDTHAVRDALGEHPGPHAVAMLRLDVLRAVRRLEEEIRTGRYSDGPLLVRGRSLGEWLALDDVADLLALHHAAGRP